MTAPTQLVRDLVNQGARALAPDSEDAKLSSEVLLTHLLRLSRTDLILKSEEAVSQTITEQFFKWIERRRRHEPVAYIIGEKEFFSLMFEVTPATLIPRPETELLVEEALKYLKIFQIEKPTFCDVGTGSGAIAIAIKHSFPSAEVTATDRNLDALAVAQRNAVRNNLEIRFVERDLLEGLDQKFHLITANLPYIPTSDLSTLAPDVRDYEPAYALDGGPDGLSLIAKLIKEAPKHLEEGGGLLVEIGIGQQDPVSELLLKSGFKILSVRDDFQKIPRVITGILP